MKGKIIYDRFSFAISFFFSGNSIQHESAGKINKTLTFITQSSPWCIQWWHCWWILGTCTAVGLRHWRGLPNGRANLFQYVTITRRVFYGRRHLKIISAADKSRRNCQFLYTMTSYGAKLKFYISQLKTPVVMKQIKMSHASWILNIIVIYTE